jgi:hypothetical protein
MVHQGREVRYVSDFLLFTHFVHFAAPVGVKLPKLDVAGSIPVSRSSNCSNCYPDQSNVGITHFGRKSDTFPVDFSSIWHLTDFDS